MAVAIGGQLNRTLGWSLLIAGFVCAIWLDPWSLGQRDTSVLAGSPRTAVRHAQAVLLGMAFCQLLVARLLTSERLPTPARRLPAWLTAIGALVYALGYALSASGAGGAWLIPIGALLNFFGFALLAGQVPVAALALRVLLSVICLGMLLDSVMGLFAWNPERFLPTYLGSETGVRLRMLRLARAAAIALPVLALLCRGIAVRGEAERRTARLGRVAMIGGAVGMPVILVAAAFTSIHLKYLLAIPADAVFAGTLVAVWLARRSASSLEFWGWLLVALSMAAGLAMGTYAFDGPLPSPSFLGAYSDFPRRLTRLAHAYAIVLGLLCIFTARELDALPAPSAKPGVDRSRPRFARCPAPSAALLAAGTVTSILMIVLVAILRLPVMLLGVGPALVAAATLLCIGPLLLRPGAEEHREESWSSPVDDPGGIARPRGDA